jgi:hypothetical protein
MKILGSKISNEDDMNKFLKVGFSENMGQWWQDKLNSLMVEKFSYVKEVGKRRVGDDEW